MRYKTEFKNWVAFKSHNAQMSRRNTSRKREKCSRERVTE